MKKQYMSPIANIFAVRLKTAILTVSGRVSEEDELDPAGPTDPEEGEGMSVRSERNGLWGNEW